MKFYRWVVLALLCGLCGCGAPASYIEETENAAEVRAEATEETEAEDPEEPEIWYIHVCGEVRSPGVYALPAGSRVFQAIEAAGGLTGEASGTAVNQAEALSDGMQVYVPAEGEEAEVRTAESGGASDGRVDLNTADLSELLTLPGIGEAKAAAILEYRAEHGGFADPAELMQVPGIKEGTYAKLADKVRT